jgi:hypothetical protein
MMDNDKLCKVCGYLKYSKRKGRIVVCKCVDNMTKKKLGLK